MYWPRHFITSCFGILKLNYRKQPFRLIVSEAETILFVKIPLSMRDILIFYGLEYSRVKNEYLSTMYRRYAIARNVFCLDFRESMII